MDEHEFMEGVEQEDEDEFVEEPMSADFDFDAINDPIALDEPTSQGFIYQPDLIIKLNSCFDLYPEEAKPSTVNSAGVDLDSLANDYTDYALMNRLVLFLFGCLKNHF